MHRGSAAVVLLLTLAAVDCGREAPPPTSDNEADLAIPVAATPAQRGRLRAVIHATGTVTPASGSDFLVVAPEPARILEMPKNAGDPVATGDVLVRFDIPTATADAARQRAEVARLQALVENTRVAQGRARDLMERGIISRRELEDADREVATAQADVARAEAARASADASVGRAIIRAPFAGVVAQRLHNPGDVVQGSAADPILRIVDPARFEVLASISPADVSRVLPGASARLTAVDSAMPVRLTVASRPAIPPGGADAIVHLLFAEPANMLVDTRADVEIDGEEHVNAVLVPPDAVLHQGNETVVLVASGDTAQRRVVTTGLTSDDAVEIVSGVAAGELVITSGQSSLSDGEKISVDVRR